MTLEDPVEIYAAGDSAEAYFVRNLLSDAGIEAKVVGDALRAAAGDLPFQIATPRVWVHAADVERARPIIEEYERRLIERAEAGNESDAEPPDNESASELFCYHCGQPVEYGQSPCPACGKDLEWGPGPGIE